MHGGLNQSDGYLLFDYSVIVLLWMHSEFEAVVFTNSPTSRTYKRCVMPGASACSDLTIWITSANSLAIRNDGSSQYRYVAIKAF